TSLSLESVFDCLAWVRLLLAIGYVKNIREKSTQLAGKRAPESEKCHHTAKYASEKENVNQRVDIKVVVVAAAVVATTVERVSERHRLDLEEMGTRGRLRSDCRIRFQFGQGATTELYAKK